MIIARIYLLRERHTLREYVKRMRVVSAITSLVTSVCSIIILHFYFIQLIKETEGKDFTIKYNYLMPYAIITTFILSVVIGFFATHLITTDD